MKDWKTIIEKHQNELETLLLVGSYGRHAGNNYGFCINSDKFLAETPTEVLNRILDICANRMKPYRSSKQYSRVSVNISASGNGIYVEYGETNKI